jgi:DNA (cytosine-5)-methyltransferase 1
VPAIAVALSISIVVVENVPQILRDKTEVVATTKGLLANAGYTVQDIVLNAKDFGVAQSRKRHFLIATRAELPPVRETLREVIGAVEPPTVAWAIKDLENIITDTIFDSPPDASDENRRRIDFLFDNDFYELPNAERPDCHKNGHRYPSIYGRMRSDQPSQTVTTGFVSPGYGRFIHPWRRRTITPHEAARLQGFPDYFRFEGAARRPLSRSDYAKLIGDAVPPPLAFYPVLCALAGLPYGERDGRSLPS